jgi:hypothetical protein
VKRCKRCNVTVPLQHCLGCLGPETVNSSIFCRVTPTVPSIANRRFVGTCVLHLQDGIIGLTQARHNVKACEKIRVLLGLFDHKDKGYMFFRNVGWISYIPADRIPLLFECLCIFFECFRSHRALGCAQPLTEIQMFLGSRVQLECGADNLTAIYGPIVYTLRDPQRLITQQTSTACYRDGVTFLYADVRISQETPMGLNGLLRG